MNRICKYVIIIAMALLFIIQVFYIKKKNKENNALVYNNMTTPVAKHKSLKEFSDELKCLKEKSILSANEVNGKWYIKVKIQGGKEKLLEEIYKLKNYEVSDYIINSNKGENSIVIEMSSKENA